MINIFTNLQNNKTLSHSEQQLANYILENPNKILQMNATQLAKECFVSSATIYRLCDKLNLSGFADLKVRISSSMNDYMKTDKEFNFNFPVNQKQTHYEIIEKICEDYDQTIISTKSLFDLDQIRYAVNAMKKAKYIDIYTSAGNLYFAQNFQFQMHEIGVKVDVPMEEYHQRLSASSSDDTHLAIIITFAGRGLLPEILFKILNKRNVPIVLISSPSYLVEDVNPIAHFFISPYENHYRKISSFSTRLSILCILDVLYASYFKIDYDDNIKKKIAYYQLINETTL